MAIDTSEILVDGAGSAAVGVARERRGRARGMQAIESFTQSRNVAVPLDGFTG